MKPVPIKAAAVIAKQYGYDQIVVIARKIGQDGNEAVTTYGVDKANCEVAARIGTFFKHHLMRWPTIVGSAEDRAKKMEDALRSIANPLGAMQERAKQEGSVLNGPVAVAMADNADYLKGIAREALEKLSPL